MMMLWALEQTVIDPATCLALGFCPAPVQTAGVAPGFMFLALGLVIAGVAGLRHNRQVNTQ